jgi:hypothetical protein
MPSPAIAIAMASMPLALLGVTYTTPAAASDRPGCATTNACIWADTMFKTSGSANARKDFVHWDGSFHNENYVGTTINAGDSASSAWNSGAQYTARFFIDTGCSGSSLDLVMGGSGVSSMGPNFNNKLSSGAFAPDVSAC